MVASSLDSILYYLAESTYGTTPTLSTFSEFGALTSFSINHTVETTVIRGVFNQTPRFNPIPTKKSIEISLDAFLQSTVNLQLLSDILTNSYTLKVIENYDGTSKIRYYQGVRFSEFTLSSGLGEIATISMSAKAKNIYSNAGSYSFSSAQFSETDPTPSSVVPSAWSDFTVTSSSFTTGNGTEGEIQQWEIKLSHEIKENYALSSGLDAEGIYKGGATYEGSMTLNFVNFDDYTRLLNDESGTLTITDGSKTITCTGVVYTGVNMSVSEQELINLEVPFQFKSLSIA